MKSTLLHLVPRAPHNLTWFLSLLSDLSIGLEAGLPSGAFTSAHLFYPQSLVRSSHGPLQPRFTLETRITGSVVQHLHSRIFAEIPPAYHFPAWRTSPTDSPRFPHGS